MSVFHISSNLFWFLSYESAGNSENVYLQRRVGIYFKRQLNRILQIYPRHSKSGESGCFSSGSLAPLRASA